MCVNAYESAEKYYYDRKYLFYGTLIPRRPRSRISI